MNAIKIILLLFTLPFATAADECFCLVDKDNHLRHSCEMQQQGYQQVIHCLDDDEKPYKVDDLSGWTRIAADQGRCHPCRQSISASRGGGDIRGKDNQTPAGNTADDRAK